MFTPFAERASRARAQLPHTLQRCTDPAPAARGKVRDLYLRGDEIFLVATDRISAFDVVVGTVPFKGAALTEQATFWLEKAQEVVTTHLLERPDPQVMRCRKAEPFPLELVVRGHLAGSLLKEPPKTRGQRYGLKIDPAIEPYAPFPEPIVTPTTKAKAGTHDEPCSLDDLVASGRISRRHLDEIVEAALALFRLGSAFAEANGLILVDSKYEFGLAGGQVVLIDEVHTADSSRFWRKATYEARRQQGEAPDMLDKERLRRWLLARGFFGEGEPPALTDDVRVELAVHYWELTEAVFGRAFDPPLGNAKARVEDVLKRALGG